MDMKDQIIKWWISRGFTFNPYRVRCLLEGYEGREGHIIDDQDIDKGIVRIAFDEYWTRPDSMSPEEANDNTWCLSDDEWEYTGVMYKED